MRLHLGRPSRLAGVGCRPGVDALSRAQWLGPQRRRDHPERLDRPGHQLEGPAARAGALLARLAPAHAVTWRASGPEQRDERPRAEGPEGDSLGRSAQRAAPGCRSPKDPSALQGRHRDGPAAVSRPAAPERADDSNASNRPSNPRRRCLPRTSSAVILHLDLDSEVPRHAPALGYWPLPIASPPRLRLLSRRAARGHRKGCFEGRPPAVPRESIQRLGDRPRAGQDDTQRTAHQGLAFETRNFIVMRVRLPPSAVARAKADSPAPPFAPPATARRAIDYQGWPLILPVECAETHARRAKTG